MTKVLESKVALITGGTTGIGRDTAVVFAKEGAKVVFTGRREAEGNETLGLVRAAGGEGLFLKSDVSKASDVQSIVQKTIEKYGRLDFAFNNAGVEGVWAPLVEQTEENWDYVHNINLKGLWICLKYEIQQMIKQGGGGRIINITSVHEDWPMPGNTAYCLSKGGMRMLTRTAGVELAPHNVLVVGVGPGAVATPINLSTMKDPALMKKLDDAIPIGRMAKPEEIASVVAFLAGDGASYMTATTVFTDGGIMHSSPGL